jgi:hypothetical protein
MRLYALALVVLAATVSCAAPMKDDAAPAVSAETLTLQDCATNQNTCFAQNPLFGIFTCPAQYAQCVATATNGIPAQVAAAISDARDCRTQAAACRAKATTATAQLSCTTDEANCVAAIVNAHLPQVVTGEEDCVTSAEDCLLGALKPSDVATCGQNLESCSVDNVVSALPPEVGTVIRDIDTCASTLASCTRAATTASALTQCTQDNISCVAGSLGVTLVQPPVADAVHCAETATSCTQHATSAADVRACAQSFVQCNGGIVAQQLTCAEKWTRCVNTTFNFLGCTIELSTCTD